MRILVATDGSDHADRAVRLTAAQAWPDGTHVRVLVVDDGQVVSREILSGSPLVVDEFDAGTEELADLAKRSVNLVQRPGWTVESEVVRGRAATAIVDGAARFEADLVVMGSRGRGMLGSLTLGSVSAEVVDHAGRPVLISRGDGRFERVILADDGSDQAEAARRIVAGWPIFEGAVIGLTSVSSVPAPLHSAIAPTVYFAALEDYERSLDEARQQRDLILRSGAEALAAAGRSVVKLPREGRPADQILAAAVEHQADLIVMGSRGETGLTRLLLGSVARNVLYEAPCSVLIAHGASGSAG